MVYDILHGFEEFQNTEESKKLDLVGKEEPCIRFRKVVYNKKEAVRVQLNKAFGLL